MSQSKKNIGHRYSFVLEHIDEKWRATVFVAACVTIAHLQFNWFDAVDSYAFLALGNRVSHAMGVAATQTVRPDPDSVVVVRIDEQAFRTRFRERSPLNRCALSSQLAAIYKAEPEIVVIDLDLSPAVVDEGNCQAQLHATLKRWARSIRTVVMEPFHSFEPAVTASRADWRKAREDDGVHFADAALPIHYGMVLHYYSGPRTLYAVARRHDRDPRPIADDASPPSLDHQRIDVRAYMTKLAPVLASWTDTPQDGPRRDEDLTGTLLALWDNPLKDKVVFFGAGFGQEDTYLTPIGKLYGVEVHAAGFWSSDPGRKPSLRLRHASALVIEVVIAFMFGIIIAWCWERYFAWRCHQGSMEEQLAWIWLPLMLGSLLVAIAMWLVIAAVLLSSLGVWLSPIPLAVGMLIESYMTGVVNAAGSKMECIPSDSAARIPALDSLSKPLHVSRKAIWWGVLVWALLLIVFH
jgi:CHASE2 domain-containing sensor protein